MKTESIRDSVSDIKGKISHKQRVLGFFLPTVNLGIVHECQIRAITESTRPVLTRDRSETPHRDTAVSTPKTTEKKDSQIIKIVQSIN